MGVHAPGAGVHFLARTQRGGRARNRRWIGAAQPSAACQHGSTAFATCAMCARTTAGCGRVCFMQITHMRTRAHVQCAGQRVLRAACDCGVRAPQCGAAYRAQGKCTAPAHPRKRAAMHAHCIPACWRARRCAAYARTVPHAACDEYWAPRNNTNTRMASPTRAHSARVIQNPCLHIMPVTNAPRTLRARAAHDRRRAACAWRRRALPTRTHL